MPTESAPQGISTGAVLVDAFPASSPWLHPQLHSAHLARERNQPEAQLPRYGILFIGILLPAHISQTGRTGVQILSLGVSRQKLEGVLRWHIVVRITWFVCYSELKSVDASKSPDNLRL